MLLLILYVIITCLVAIGLVKLIDKFLPSGARIVVSVILWAATAFIAYLIYSSVMKPIEFEKAKDDRYKAAVQKMIDLKKAQLGYKAIHGEYADTFEKLVNFIDSEKFAIVTRRDTSVIDATKNQAYNIVTDATGAGGYFKDIVVKDTIGYVSVKDSLFKNNDRYKSLDIVKYKGVEVPVTMKTSFVIRNETKLPVFQAVIDKNALLTGLDEELLAQENKVEDINEINGSEITLGSLVEITLTGNWPKRYGSND